MERQFLYIFLLKLIITDVRAELRERENRREYDELRRDSNFAARRTHQDEEQRRVDRDERRFERRNDVNRRQGLFFFNFLFSKSF